MAFTYRPDNGQPDTQASGNHASSSSSRGDPGLPPRLPPRLPPPVPPRPAGFGHQPLRPDNTPSVGLSLREQLRLNSTPMGDSQASSSESSTQKQSSGSNDAPNPSQSEILSGQSASSKPVDKIDLINKMLDGIRVSAQPSSTPEHERHDGESGNSQSQATASGARKPSVSDDTSSSSTEKPTQSKSFRPPSLSQCSRYDLAGPRMSPVTECIGIPVAFATTWYTHPIAPEYNICSYCYNQHIRHTMFENVFRGDYIEDGKMRMCLFNRARMKDVLFKDAMRKGSLAEVENFLSQRRKISACTGSAGVQGPNPRGHWYRVKDNQTPQMVVCKACYEDYVLAEHFADNFQPAPAQPAANAWSCDFSVSFILDEYQRCAQENDWQRFVNGVNTRLTLPPCPGPKAVHPAEKQWFEPVNGPIGFLVCSTCYCDSIHYTTEQSKWRDAEQNISKYGASVKCCFGTFNMAMAANRTLRETHDYSLFWKCAQTLADQPYCDPKGTTNTTWYTLLDDPDQFAICGACYVLIVETWGVRDYFKPRTSLYKSSKWVCCLNQGDPRFLFYLSKLMELMLTRDAAPLTDFAIEYGPLPLCKRDQDFKNGAWYGWPDCTICPECHHEFIRETALADSMPLRGQRLDNWRMCEMYSPRMRKMYLEACALNPPDPTALLVYSAQRRNIYAATMIQVRQLRDQQTIKLLQQQSLNNSSLLYTSIGNNVANTMGYTHTYGQVGVGYGFRNEWELDGARYSQQAMALGDEIRSSSFSMPGADLERRWREVE